MVSFENDNIPQYLLSKISLNKVDKVACNKMVSCKHVHGITNKIELQNIINSYNNIDKIVYIFLISDTIDIFNIPDNVRLYRTSLYKSKQNKNEFLLPYIWEDLQPFPVLPKSEKPIIGFCGLNCIHRNKTITLFKNNRNVISNFIIRNKFWGGKPHDPKIISEFQDNMQSSHFNICNRGAGNFSMRFYQTLSCGRIPILLNTDMVLPFENEINWNDSIVIAESEEELVENY